jgi:hypothetical protein
LSLTTFRFKGQIINLNGNGEELQWLEHETDHVPPSSTEVNVQRYISTPLSMALYEIKLIF